MSSEMQYIDPNTSTIIICVIFSVVFTIFIIVMCKSYIKRRKRNVDMLFPKSKINAGAHTHRSRKTKLTNKNLNCKLNLISTRNY